MPDTPITVDETHTSADSDRTAGRDTKAGDVPAFRSWVPRLGIAAWSFVGFVAAAIIVVVALAAVSEIVLPLTFAAVLAVIFKPQVGVLKRHGFKPTLAAGLVVLGLLALMTVVLVATVRGVTAQADEIGSSVDAAINKAVDTLALDQGSPDEARAAVEELTPTIAQGFLAELLPPGG